MTQTFEELPASLQQLTFETMDSFLKKRFGRNHPPLTGLKNAEGCYTNYAYVLSDQNPWRIILNIEGSNTVMDGALIQQIDQTMSEVTTNNPPIEIKNRGGMYRRFPSVAVKEALVNSVMHSDLSAGNSIEVSMSNECMSVKSPGGIYSPEEWKDITCTNPRNMMLANMLVRIGYASLKGRGIMLMKNCYVGSGLVPCMIHGKDEFMTRLPALDNPVKEPYVGGHLVERYLETKRGALISDVSRDLMVSVYLAKKMIDKLEDEGKVFTLGIGSKRRAYLVKYSKVNELIKSERIQMK